MQDRSKRVAPEKQQQTVGERKEDEGGGKRGGRGGRGGDTEGGENQERGGERKSYDVCRVQVSMSTELLSKITDIYRVVQELHKVRRSCYQQQETYHSLLQVRLPSGRVLRHNFPATAYLHEVATFVMSSEPKIRSVQLVQVSFAQHACIYRNHNL